MFFRGNGGQSRGVSGFRQGALLLGSPPGTGSLDRHLLDLAAVDPRFPTDAIQRLPPLVEVQEAQGDSGPPGGARGKAPYLAILLLAACQSTPNTGPEAWWHDAVGGKIAQQRPPAPGEKDPYPNLATVPAKPPPADTAAWNKVTSALIMDRIAANQAAALAPIPPARPTVVPPARPTVAPAPADGPSMSLSALTAPPPAAPPNPRTTTPPPPVAAPIARPPIPTGPKISTALPALPALPVREPPRPNIAPGPPPPLVPATAAAPPPALRAANDITVDFSPRSFALTDAALAQIRAIAEAHGELGIAVVGYGDARTSDALAQAAALDLGLSRAQALATALAARGVPAREIRVAAQAAGRGASLRLLQ